MLPDEIIDAFLEVDTNFALVNKQWWKRSRKYYASKYSMVVHIVNPWYELEMIVFRYEWVRPNSFWRGNDFKDVVYMTRDHILRPKNYETALSLVLSKESPDILYGKIRNGTIVAPELEPVVWLCESHYYYSCGCDRIEMTKRNQRNYDRRRDFMKNLLRQ